MRRRTLATSAAAVFAALAIVPASTGVTTPGPVALAEVKAVGVIHADLTVSYTGNDNRLVWAEFGPTTAYGQQTYPVGASPAGAGYTFPIAITDLKPSTTYHFRLVSQPLAGGDTIATGDYRLRTGKAKKPHFGKAVIHSGGCVDVTVPVFSGGYDTSGSVGGRSFSYSALTADTGASVTAYMGCYPHGTKVGVLFIASNQLGSIMRRKTVTVGAGT